MTSNPQDYRDEQFRAIELKLERLQRRYFNLDLAFEFRIWVLDQRARPDDRCVDLEYDFMQYLERRNRRAEEARSGKNWEPAFENAPHLRSGFALLVAHWGQEAFMSRERAAVYAEEFRSWSEAEFTAACWAVIRVHRGHHFPLVSDIRAAREDTDGSVPAAATQDDTTARDVARRAELDELIAALPEDARKELETGAAERLAKIGDRGNLGLKRTVLLRIYLRLAYEGLDSEMNTLPDAEYAQLKARAEEQLGEIGEASLPEYCQIMREIYLRQRYDKRQGTKVGIEDRVEWSR